MATNFEIVFDADSFVPPATDSADRGVAQNRSYLGFAATTANESMYSSAVRWPNAYTGSGTLKADIHYFTGATSGGVTWEVRVEAVSDNDAINLATASSFETPSGTNNRATVSAGPSTANYLDVATATLTDKDSVAVGDLVRFQLTRLQNDSNDTAAQDANVVCLTVYEDV